MTTASTFCSRSSSAICQHDRLVQLLKYPAAEVQAFGDLEAKRPSHERVVASDVVLRQVHLQVVHVVRIVDDPLPPPQLQGVAEALGRDDRYPGALVLDDGVDPDRGAVGEEVDLGQVDARFGDGVDHSVGLVGRSGGGLSHDDSARFIHGHQVGEGPPNICPDAIVHCQWTVSVAVMSGRGASEPDGPTIAVTRAVRA